MPTADFDYGREAFAFIELLDRLSTTDEIMHAMERALAPFGIENIIIAGILPSPGQRFDRLVLATQWPSEFLALYVDKDYIHFDPIALSCLRSANAFEWVGSSYDQDKEPRTVEVMHRAADFRLARGFTVPIHGPHGYEAAVSMAGVDLDLKPGSKPGLHLMALYAFDRVRCLLARVADDPPSLTSREREVLTWAAQGKSAWEIGEILNIAKRTVDEHVQSTFRKLGAVNRTQAVAIALRDRLISL